MKLAIISHTEHYIDSNGQIVGWGPTIREVNHLIHHFEEIWHIGVLKEGPAPPSSLPYNSDKIFFIPIPPFGGPKPLDKLRIISIIPSIISKINNTLNNVDVWQFRAPTGIGVFIIPYLSWFIRKKGWFKYAGNWIQNGPPLGYGIQRFWLKKLQRRPVTINGKWKLEPSHCIPFDNPCLDDDDLNTGKLITSKKKFNGSIEICFVGRLEESKGINILLQSISKMNFERSEITAIHIVGDGVLMEKCQSYAIKSGLPFIFHGFLPQQEVFSIYKRSHIFILPSFSEGFPKVLAEAVNFGCVPIVSNVSSIGQYIQSGYNGFLLTEISSESIINSLELALENRSTLKTISTKANQLSSLFTYQRYCYRILNEII